MKRIILIFTLLIGSNIFNFCSSQTLIGNVYFFWAKGNTLAGLSSIFIDEKYVGKINRKKFIIRDVEQGEHNVTFSGRRKEELDKDAAEWSTTINVEAGKNYYVQCEYINSTFSNTFYCVEVPESTFNELVSQHKYQKNKE